jgi:hypothetical protein
LNLFVVYLEKKKEEEEEERINIDVFLEMILLHV